MIETAFRDDEHELAGLSRHLHPAHCGANCSTGARVEVFITHIKPGEMDAVMARSARWAAGTGSPPCAAVTRSNSAAAERRLVHRYCVQGAVKSWLA